MATIAVGDIHGNIAALNDLLEKVLPELSTSDSLVFLGDYIDRGPSVRRCIERLIEWIVYGHHRNGREMVMDGHNLVGRIGRWESTRSPLAS